VGSQDQSQQRPARAQARAKAGQLGRSEVDVGLVQQSAEVADVAQGPFHQARHRVQWLLEHVILLEQVLLGRRAGAGKLVQPVLDAAGGRIRAEEATPTKAAMAINSRLISSLSVSCSDVGWALGSANQHLSDCRLSLRESGVLSRIGCEFIINQNACTQHTVCRHTRKLLHLVHAII
jgi:hypothetical protein